jgi:pimeloyl-ACP methyl ester carboxylesterase
MIVAILAAAAFQAAPCDLKDIPAAEQPDAAVVQCGWVTAPLKADDARSKTIRLWTARIRTTATGAPGEPTLFINGGPGVATVDSLLPALPVSKTVAMLRKQGDLILFDQRGSGRSEEVLCPQLGDSLKAVADRGLAAPEEEAEKRALFVSCRKSLEASGVDLSAYTTAATVGDMEAIRQAFGVERWNLASISYGSLVAMHAMRTRPQTIRAVILNSPYPPNSVSWAEQVSIAANAYEAIDRACGAQPACRARFGDLVPKLEATLARLEATPLADGERKITGRLFAEALWPLAVQSSTVKFVPLAIDRAHAGDAELIKGMVRTFAGGQSFGDFSYAQGMAIGCHEGGRTHEWYVRARALHPGLASASPDDSWDQLCAAYRPGYADASFFAPVASSIPTLIYAGLLDAATPPVDAYQATRFLTKATVVEVAGASHGPMARDECTLGIAAAFLANPEAAPDTRCMASRPPLEFATDGLMEMLEPAKP